MTEKWKKAPFVLTAIASALLVGCNGSEAEPKLESQPEQIIQSNSISGIALDGYLKNAKVCLDLNRNLTCESSDGAIVLTDDHGHYVLPYSQEELANSYILVEAISNQTIDMDQPETPIKHAFTLTGPATKEAVISPLTTVIKMLADKQAISFKSAQEQLASQLEVEPDRLTSDFIAGQHEQDKKLHALAQGLTNVMQEAEQAAVADGVTRLDARKGIATKLAMIDLASLKARTDKFAGTASQNPAAMSTELKDFADDLTVSHDEIDSNRVVVRPLAPKRGTINDTADTFDWEWVGVLKDPAFYEYSTDGGESWKAVTQKPVYVGGEAFAIGSVQVRVKALTDKDQQAGKVVKNTVAFTETLTPSAPASLTLDDAQNTIGWSWVPGFPELEDYEYSLDGGFTWMVAESNPQAIGDIDLDAGQVAVRIVTDEAVGRPAGLPVLSTKPLTVTPKAPASPVISQFDDKNNYFDWEPVDNFDKVTDYEVFINGRWETPAGFRVYVGNRAIAKNTLRLRVKRNTENGRPHGQEVRVTQAFTEQKDMPLAPENITVNDALNQLGWDIVGEFTDAEQYEISTNKGSEWETANGNPHQLSDSAFDKGAVCVRVKEKAQALVSNPQGVMACSLQPFTPTPPTPAAPTNDVIDDAKDQFGWTPVSGFPAPTDYEMSIQGEEWQLVTDNPMQLPADQYYSYDDIRIRVKKDALTGRQPGDILSNSEPFTPTPAQPEAPAPAILDDKANTLDWTFVPSFTEPSDYEFSLNGGKTWQAVNEKPLVVGDVDLAAGQVQVRVKADDRTGMPAGQVLSNAEDFLVEAVPAYQLLTQSGNKTDDRYQAACAYDTKSGLTWQLYKPYEAKRDTFSNALKFAGKMNAVQACQKSNWRLPTLDELKGLMPIDSNIFFADNSNQYYRCYFTNRQVKAYTQECFDFIDQKVTSAYTASWSPSYNNYRLVAD